MTVSAVYDFAQYIYPVPTTSPEQTNSSLKAFQRNGWDPIGLNSSYVELTPYLYSGTSFDVTVTKRTSCL